MTHPNFNHQGINHPSYMEYFKLRSQPFSEHAPRESLWTDSRMEEGLARLQHLVQNGLLGLVTGASGLGKSALLKRFMGEQSPQHCTPIYCHLAHLSGNGLLKVVLGQLGEVPRRGKDKQTSPEHRISLVLLSVNQVGLAGLERGAGLWL